MANLDDKIAELEAAYSSFKDVISPEERRRYGELTDIANSGQGTREVFEEWGRLQQRISKYDNVIDSYSYLKDMCELARNDGAETQESIAAEIGDLIQEMNELIILKKLNGRYDGNNAIISLHIGATGEALTDQINQLARAYSNFADRRGFSVETIDSNGNTCAVRIIGYNAYGFLRGEHGVHRFIHMGFNGKTETKTLTGYIAVSVEPEVENPSIVLGEPDLSYERFGASSKGGQHANKNQTGVRITHKPTGASATARGRSLKDNMKSAMSVLYSRVCQYHERQSVGHGEEVVSPSKARHFRTYKLTGTKYIKDHRTGIEASDIRGLLTGDLDMFILGYHGTASK